MTCIEGLFGRVDEAEIDDFDAGTLQLARDLGQIAFQTFLETENWGQYASSPMPNRPIFVLFTATRGWLCLRIPRRIPKNV